MNLAEVLKHVFSDKDLTEEVIDYKVTHTNTDNYTIEAGTKLTLQITKEKI